MFAKVPGGAAGAPVRWKSKLSRLYKLSLEEMKE